MVATPHTVVLAVALIALLCPCAIVLLARSDRAKRRAWIRRARIDMPALRRLDRTLRDDARPLPSRPVPPLTQVEAELRRLNGQRRGGPTAVLGAVAVRRQDLLP